MQPQQLEEMGVGGGRQSSLVLSIDLKSKTCQD